MNPGVPGFDPELPMVNGQVLGISIRHRLLTPGFLVFASACELYGNLASIS